MFVNLNAKTINMQNDDKYNQIYRESNNIVLKPYNVPPKISEAKKQNHLS